MRFFAYPFLWYISLIHLQQRISVLLCEGVLLHLDLPYPSSPTIFNALKMHSTYFIHGFRFTPTVPQLAANLQLPARGRKESIGISLTCSTERPAAGWPKHYPRNPTIPKKEPPNHPPLSVWVAVRRDDEVIMHRWGLFLPPLNILRAFAEVNASVCCKRCKHRFRSIHTLSCTCSRKDKRPKQHTSATWHRYMAYEHGVGCRCWGVPSVLQKDTWTGRWASSASLGSSSAGMHSTGDDALCWFLPHEYSEFDCEEDWLVQCYEMQCSWHLTTQLGSELMRVERVHGGKIAVTTCCYCYMRFYGAVRKQGNGDIRWSKATYALR